MSHDYIYGSDVQAEECEDEDVLRSVNEVTKADSDVLGADSAVPTKWWLIFGAGLLAAFVVGGKLAR